MSTSIWKKNKKILEERNSLLAEKLEELQSGETLSVTSEKGYERMITAGVSVVEGRNVLYVETNGKTYQFDSLYNSEQLMDLWIHGIPKLNLNAKIFLFGFGNGMYVRKLLASADDTINVIVYEPSLLILRTAMEYVDLSNFLGDSRLTLLVKGCFEGELEDCLYDMLDYRDIDGLIYYNYLNYNRVFKDEFNFYMDKLQHTVHAIASTQSVMTRYGARYNMNTIRNLNTFLSSKSLENLYDRMPKGLTAIVVAAGPSLDKNVEQLKKAKGRCLIIAVDSALRVLLRHGIRPDLCMSIDGKKMARHFSEPDAKKVPLVSQLLANFEIVSAHEGPVFFVSDLNHHIQHFLIEKDIFLPVLATGGSVANDAFSLANALGIRTIILVGQDLAYTDSRTHSEESVRGAFHTDISSLKNNIWMEGIDGNQILSSTEFDLYKRWFENQIATQPEMRVIDATEGGAKIEGSIMETLEDAIRTECTASVDFEALIAETDELMSEEKKQAFLSYIGGMGEQLDICADKAQEGIRIYDKLLDYAVSGRYKVGQMKKLCQKSDEIVQFLEHTPVMEYVQNQMQTYTTDKLEDVYRTEQDEHREILAVCMRGKEAMEVTKKNIVSFKMNLTNWMPDFKGGKEDIK